MLCFMKDHTPNVLCPGTRHKMNPWVVKWRFLAGSYSTFSFIGDYASVNVMITHGF